MIELRKKIEELETKLREKKKNKTMPCNTIMDNDVSNWRQDINRYFNFASFGRLGKKSHSELEAYILEKLV